MEAVPTLPELGDRICILGPSGSGKSTLAAAIARKRGLPVVHLDRLHHVPGSNWLKRPDVEFLHLHHEAIHDERWVMDGNYSACLPDRLRRATGFILLDFPRLASLYRYVRRALFEHDRIGSLRSGRENLNFAMLHHITVVSPRNRRRYAQLYRGLTLPKARFTSATALKLAYAAWDLQR